MRKIIVFMFVVVIAVFAVTTVSAAEQVATRYFTEEFDTEATVDQPLATSTSAEDGFNGWVLQRDVPQQTGTEYTSHFEKATAEGTELTVTADPKDSTNKVLKIKRTKGTDTNSEILQGSRNLNGNVTLNNETCDMVKISMKYMYINGDKYLFTASPAATKIRNDYWTPDGGSNATYSTDALAIMSKKPNEWIDLEFIMNYKNSTISLYADDVLISTESITTMPEVSKIIFRQDRNSSLAASTIYVDDVYVDAITTVASYKTDKIFYSTANGEFTATATDGGLLKQAYITKADTASGNVKTVFVCYDAEKNMQAIKVIDLTAADFDENNLAIKTVDMELPDNVDLTGGETKVLFLESFTTMKPIEEASVFDITADKAPTLFLLGDSGMSKYKEAHFPRAGTGMFIGNYFDDIDVLNYATSGAGTDTTLGLEGADYDHSGKWRTIQSSVTAGDYLLIQLGANDAHDNIGVENFISNMEFIVDTMHKKGVNVIMGSIRLHHVFDENGKFDATFDENGNFTGSNMISDDNGDNYLEALYNYTYEKEAENTPGFMSIDTAAFVAEWIGPDATPNGDCAKMFMLDTHRDYNRELYDSDPRGANSTFSEYGIIDPVHLTIYGADIIAQGTAQMIYDLDVPLSEYVNVEKLDDVITYPHFDYQYAE